MKSYSPGVARNELPWVDVQQEFFPQPQRGCATRHFPDSLPFGFPIPRVVSTRRRAIRHWLVLAGTRLLARLRLPRLQRGSHALVGRAPKESMTRRSNHGPANLL